MPLDTKFNISLIAGTIAELAALIKVTSISPAEIAFLISKDFVVFLTFYGDVAEIKKMTQKLLFLSKLKLVGATIFLRDFFLHQQRSR